MQIVLKQLYSIKRGNSVSFSSGQQFKSRLQQSQIVQRTNITLTFFTLIQSSFT